MGEKYSPEKLAALRSIAHVKGGRTKHTDAGTVLARTEELHTDEGEHIRKHTDVKGNEITEHQDGRQDVNVHPEPLIVELTQGV